MEDELLSELVDVRNFKRLHHSVIIRNLTSNVVLGKKFQIEIIEFLEGGLIIKMGPRSCAIGHLLSILFINDKIFEKLRALPDIGSIKGALEVLGRVKNIENKEREQLINIEFTQYDNVKWRKFFDLYRFRQKQINETVSMKSV